MPTEQARRQPVPGAISWGSRRHRRARLRCLCRNGSGARQTPPGPEIGRLTSVYDEALAVPRARAIRIAGEAPAPLRAGIPGPIPPDRRAGLRSPRSWNKMPWFESHAEGNK